MTRRMEGTLAQMTTSVMLYFIGSCDCLSGLAWSLGTKDARYD